LTLATAQWTCALVGVAVNGRDGLVTGIEADRREGLLGPTDQLLIGERLRFGFRQRDDDVLDLVLDP